MATLAWIVGSGVLMSLIALVGSVTLLVRPAGWLVGGGLFHLIPAALAAAPSDDDPQELGDFGVLVHGGWSRKRALLTNALSGSTFLLGEQDAEHGRQRRSLRRVSRRGRHHGRRDGPRSIAERRAGHYPFWSFSAHDALATAGGMPSATRVG
jgi:hypothetical protein